MEEFNIYRSKTLKYCASCLHTEEATKLFTMNTYGWIFTSLFTNLFLTEELHDSWICSWCVRRLENARKLLENFQRAQYLLAKIADNIYPCNLTQETALALSSEIDDLKKKTRLHVNNILENSNMNNTRIGECKIEIKTEDNVSGNEIENSLDDRFEFPLDLDISDYHDTQYRLTRSRKVKSKMKQKRKSNKKTLISKKKNDGKSKSIVEKKENVSKKCEKNNKSKAESLNVTNKINSQDSQIFINNEINEKEMKCKKENTRKDVADSKNNLSPIYELESVTIKSVDKIEKSNEEGDGKVCRTTSKLKTLKKNKKARPYLPHLPRLACTECNQLFIKEIALENHMYRDHKKKFRCELCDKKFTREEYLKTHMARQHEPKSGIFECDICGIIYKHRVKIVAHMIKHEKYGPSLKDIEKIVCHHCGKICDRNHISNHLLTHSETKGYPCTYCDASFKVAQILENHVKRKHLDPDIGRTFLCPQCPKKFYTSTEVKYHVKAAHLLQSHPCPHCTKSFPIKGNLRAHILRVHEKVPAIRDKKCDLCDKAFSTRRHLRHHRYTHTGEKPYKCDLCTSAYNQKYCLTLHKRRAHNIDKPKTVVKDFNNPTVSNIPLGEEFSNNVGNWYA